MIDDARIPLLLAAAMGSEVELLDDEEAEFVERLKDEIAANPGMAPEVPLDIYAD